MIRDWLDWFKSTSKNTKTFVAILLVLGIILVIVAFISIATILKAQSSHTEVVQEQHAAHPGEQQLAKNSPYSFPYELTQVSMAVMSKKGTRTAYAQFSLTLDCPSEESQKLMAMNRAKLLDSVFLVGSNFYLDDFSPEHAPKSLKKFKTDLLEKYQEQFHSEAPREIVLKDWFIN
jgi:hypothetical protein